MALVRTKKRGSDVSISSAKKRAASDSPESPSTPQHRSPIKKRKTGISLQQKRALIENLQLEITERARRLRAQYHLQAQGLRSRIEIRVNRIPTALRKLKMGDLLVKYMDQEQQRTTTRPLPAKDLPSRMSPQKHTQHPSRTQYPGRIQKRLSNVITGDKENELENGEHLKKRARGADAGLVRPTQVLSPTSSNSRLANRGGGSSPTKSQIARPSSPLKTNGANRSVIGAGLLTSMVEKAKATRAGGRKMTTISNASSSSSGTTAPTRTKRAAPAPKAPTSRPGTRMTRRTSGNSESSVGSTNTVVRKTGAGKGATATKKTVMGALKKGVAGVGKSSAAKPAAPTSTNASGRVLRRRG